MEIKELAELSFEEALSQLEEIVEALESGDVALEQAINLFQEGMKLSQFCSQKLDKVEQKIEMLMEKDGEVTVKPMDIEEDR